jgi:carbamoyl-phosphate synthase large subunit
VDPVNVIAVSGVSGNIAQGVVKGLRAGRIHFRIVGLDGSADNVGFYMVDQGIPMPLVHEAHYIDRLIEVLREQRAELYLMGIDSEVPLVSAARARIESESGCRVMVCADSVVRRATDKLETSRMLSELGLRAPKTLPGDTAADAVLDRLGLPLIAKPRRGNGSRGVQRIESKAGLIEWQARAGAGHCVQEHLPGTEFTCGLLYDREGSFRDHVCFQRRLERGTTMEARVVRIEALDQVVRRFGQLVSAEGSINLQLRMDREGCPLIFEINPRFSGTTAFRVACGFNDPLRVALHYLRDEPIEPVEVRPVQIFRYLEQWVVPIR